MESFFKYLNQHVKLNEEEVSLLHSKAISRTYLKNQYIVQAGDICRYQTFIISGITRTFCLDQNGTEHVLSFGIENWWVGDLSSFITQEPADFNVQCLNNTEVVQISFDGMESLFQELPKMERFFRLIVEKAYTKSQKRIVSNFSFSAKERYLQFLEEYPEIAKRVPQYMLASYLGITKEFLSKIRNEISKS